MKPRFAIHRPILPLIACTTTLFTLCCAKAADLTWDSNTGTTGAQNAAGNWVTGTNNWWNGSANQNWANNDNATFGAGAGGAADTITVTSAVTANNIIFAAPASGNFTVNGGTIVLNGALTNTASNSVTVGSNLTGPGSITKSNMGGLNLNGDNSGLEGAISLTGGTISPGHVNAFGTSTTGTTISSGARVQFNNLALASNSIIPEPFTISGTGISNTGVFNIGGSRSMRLSGPITLAGDSLIKGDGSTGFTFSNTMNLAGFTASFTKDGAATETMLISGNVIGTGGITKNSAFTLTLTGAGNTFSGPMTVNGGTLNFGNGGASVSMGSGNISLAATTTLRIAFTNATSLSMGNLISSAGTVSKGGTGTLAITQAANTFTGPFIAGGGQVNVVKLANGAVNSSIGASTNVASNLQLNGGNLAYNGTGAAVTDRLCQMVAGGGFFNNSDNTTGGVMSFTNTAAITHTNLNTNRTLTLGGSYTGGVNTFAPQITATGGTGTTNVSIASPSTWELTNTAQTYTGTTTVNSGATLRVGSDTAIGTGALVNVGTFQPNASFTLNAARGITIGPNAASGTGTFDIASGLTLTADGVVSNNGAQADALIKSGAGTLVLNADNAYSGNTFIDEGILKLGASGLIDASPVIELATASTLDVSAATGWALLSAQSIIGNGTVTGPTVIQGKLSPGSGDIGTLAFTGDLDLQGIFDVEIRSTGVDAISTTGALSASAGTINVSFIDAPTPGTYPIASYGTRSGIPTVNLGYLPDSRLATTVDMGSGTADSIDLTISGVPVDLTWDGQFGTEWKLGSTQLNFDNSGSDDVFKQLDSVTFNDGSTSKNVVLTGELSPAEIIFDNTATYTLSGSGFIGGATTITKLNTGTVILATNNTNTGVTTISGGVLQLGNGGTSGALGSGNILNDATLRINRSDSLTIPNVISGSGSLAQAGTGTTTLTGTNSYAGATSITGGALSVSSDANLGAAPASPTAGHLVVNGGTLLASAGFSLNANRGVALGPVDAAGTGTIEVQTGGLTVAAIIADNGPAGTGSLVKNGAGVLTLTAANTYRGTTTINLGGVFLNNSSGFGDPVAGTSVAAGAYIYLLNPAQTTAIAEPFTISGNGAGNGAIRAGSDKRYTLTGEVALAASASIWCDGGSAIDITGAITGIDTDLLFFNGNPNSTLSGAISLGTGSFTKSGGGITIVNGPVSYSGTTTVTAATLQLNSTHTGAGPYTVAGTLTGSGGTDATVNINGILAPGNGVGTFATGNLNFGAAATLAIQINTGSVTADQVVVTGNVDTGGNTVNLTLTDVGGNVTLPAGTKLVLVDYSGIWDDTDIVHIAGNPVPNGSTISLGANNYTVDYSDDSLGGTAMTLTVTSGFNSWINDFIADLPNAADRLPGADPDKDGRDNLLEFALDGDPADGSNNGKAMVLTTDSNDAGTDRELTLTLAVRNGAVPGAGPNGSATLTVDGIVYSIQGSATLGIWDKAIAEVSPAFTLNPAPNAGWSARTFKVTDSDNLPDKRFIRVGVQ